MLRIYYYISFHTTNAAIKNKVPQIKSIFLRAIKLITYVVLLTLIPPRMIDVIRRGKESVDNDILSDYKNEIAEIVTSSSNICE